MAGNSVESTPVKMAATFGLEAKVHFFKNQDLVNGPQFIKKRGMMAFDFNF